MHALRIALVALVAIIMGTVVLYGIKDIEVLTITPKVRQSAPDGKYKALSGGITHYEEAGPIDGQVVVLVHGFSVPYYIWDGTFEALVEAGYRVIRYDMFGRGYSDRPDAVYDQEFYALQLKELIEILELPTPVDIAALSFGGPVSASFTTRYPEMVRKLVLIDPAFQFMAAPAVPKFITNYYWTVFVAPGLAESQWGDFLHSENFPDWAVKYDFQMHYKGFRNAIISTRYDYTGWPTHDYEEIGEMGKPVMLVWGKEDKVTPFQEGSVELIEDMDPEFLPVDDAAHLPHLEHPEIVNPAIIRFLGKE